MVTLPAGDAPCQSWADVEARLGTRIQASGVKGEVSGARGVQGVLEMEIHATNQGRWQLWLTLIGSAPAERLLTLLLGLRREGCREWDIRHASVDAALAEGLRRLGPEYQGCGDQPASSARLGHCCCGSGDLHLRGTPKCRQTNREPRESGEWYAGLG